MADIELKKCPFCGSDAKFVRIEENYGNARIGGVKVVCTGCNINTRHMLCTQDNAKEVVAQIWNRRVSEV